MTTGYFNWMRLVPEKVPEVFTESSWTHLNINVIREEKEKLILEFKCVSENDSAVYLCLRVFGNNWTFIKQVKLIVTDPPVNHSTPAATVPSPTTRPVNWTCFPPGKFQSQPSSVLVEGAQEFNCDGDPEEPFARKCLFNFFMNVSLSNTTGFGSVASCGERTQQGASANACDSTKHDKVHIVMSVALTVSLTCIAVLLHSIKKLKSQLQRRDMTELQDGASGVQQDPSSRSVIYATNLRFQRRADSNGRQGTNQRECVYSAVKKHRSGNIIRV
ncbi:uncharacterized protein ACB058_011622 [Synchiropus picturatus]